MATSGRAGLDHPSAVRHLRTADPRLRHVIDRVGPCRLTTPSRPDVFHDLSRSIVFQQLNGTAAGTIFRRFKELYPERKFPHPDDILATSDRRLRSAGLSPQKLSYLKDLSAKINDGTVDLRAVRPRERKRMGGGSGDVISDREGPCPKSLPPWKGKKHALEGAQRVTGDRGRCVAWWCLALLSWL